MQVLFPALAGDAAFRADMQNRSNKQIGILWEHLPSEDSAQLVRQAVALILAEIERDSTADGFDKIAAPGHAEGVPVENNNQSKPTKP